MAKFSVPSILDHIYRHYEKDAGKMLIHTGTIGWILSSAAQIFAIVTNEKIPKEQKMFLVPQEFMDACINILSFYFVTRSFSSMAEKLTKTGRWIPSNVKNALIKKGFKDRIGKFDFNIEEEAKLKGSVKRSFELFSNGIGLIATTIGTVISCNIITPIVRNLYASHRQKENIAKINNPAPSLVDTKNPKDRAKYIIRRTSLQTFMNRDNLKV